MSSVPVKLILDTDIDTDCDDAGALAVFHALADRGWVTPLGVICSVPIQWCASCVHAINRWHGKADLPVGLISVPDWATNPAHNAYRLHRAKLTRNETVPLYNELVTKEFFDSGETPPSEDAVALYRRLLAQAGDHEVTICAIGTLTALAQLLRSEPDQYSPLTGRELVRKKVVRLVSMAVSAPPDGFEAFNWRMDLPSAAFVLREWPATLEISAHGNKVVAGERFLAQALQSNPVRLAYDSFLQLLGHRNRPSWDQLALLHASGHARNELRFQGGWSVSIHPDTGKYAWTERVDGPEHGRVIPLAKDEVLSSMVEDFMIEADTLGRAVS